jgi:hypothetical protein
MATTEPATNDRIVQLLEEIREQLAELNKKLERR